MPQHYKLIDGTLEIDGVRMHQTARKSPTEDAKDKANALKARLGIDALDLCTGLGYSAIALAQKGCNVITIEIDEKVIGISKENPDSSPLFENPRIKRFGGDAVEFVKTLPDESFQIISHDPPRLSLAGELYSEAFYRELFRVLIPGGRLFHYTGKPGEKSGKNIRRGVNERLKKAGFSGVSWKESLAGFLAHKGG